MIHCLSYELKRIRKIIEFSSKFEQKLGQTG